MSVDPQTFRRTLGSFASGVTIITTADPQTKAPYGVTVSAFSSVSLDPPLVLFCLDNRSSSHTIIRTSGHFGVNILGENQADVSNLFASKTEDKWQKVTYTSGTHDIPVLAGTSAHMECQVVHAYDGGDHTIFVGQVLSASVDDSVSPLLYCRGSYAKLAKE